VPAKWRTRLARTGLPIWRPATAVPAATVPFGAGDGEVHNGGGGKLSMSCAEEQGVAWLG